MWDIGKSIIYGVEEKNHNLSQLGMSGRDEMIIVGREKLKENSG